MYIQVAGAAGFFIIQFLTPLAINYL